jgi:hypothetical protein
MKNIARLVLFFTLCFVITLAGAGIVTYFQLSVSAARTIPAGLRVGLAEFLPAFQGVFPLVLYSAVLIALSYTVRRNISLPAAMISLFILSGAVTLGVFLGFRYMENLDALFTESIVKNREQKTLGAPGLILSQENTVIVVLGDPGTAGSPRVAALPGRPLIYQEIPVGPDNTIPTLPPVSFRSGDSFLMGGILTDSSLAAKQFETRLTAGFLPFGFYGGALIFLLLSLRFILNIGAWPLANLFSGALVFRGILAFQVFIESQTIRDFFSHFWGKGIDNYMMSPLIFGGLGIIILLYTLLITIAHGRMGKPKERMSRFSKRREGRQ